MDSQVRSPPMSLRRGSLGYEYQRASNTDPNTPPRAHVASSISSGVFSCLGNNSTVPGGQRVVAPRRLHPSLPAWWSLVGRQLSGKCSWLPHPLHPHSNPTRGPPNGPVPSSLQPERRATLLPGISECLACIGINVVEYPCTYAAFATPCACFYLCIPSISHPHSLSPPPPIHAHPCHRLAAAATVTLLSTTTSVTSSSKHRQAQRRSDR